MKLLKDSGAEMVALRTDAIHDNNCLIYLHEQDLIKLAQDIVISGNEGDLQVNYFPSRQCFHQLHKSLEWYSLMRVVYL